MLLQLSDILPRYVFLVDKCNFMVIKLLFVISIKCVKKMKCTQHTYTIQNLYFIYVEEEVTKQTINKLHKTFS